MPPFVNVVVHRERANGLHRRDFSGVQVNVGEGDLRTCYDHNYSTLIDYFRGARIAEIASTDAGEQTIEVVLLRDGGTDLTDRLRLLGGGPTNERHGGDHPRLQWHHVSGCGQPEEHDDVWVTNDGAAWTEWPDVLPSPCYGGSVIVDRDRLLLAGGSEPCDGILESPDGLTWTVLGPMPAPRDNGRLIRHQGFIVYAAGDESDVPTSDVWRSDDASAWRSVGNLPEPRVGGGLVTFTPSLPDRP